MDLPFSFTRRLKSFIINYILFKGMVTKNAMKVKYYISYVVIIISKKCLLETVVYTMARSEIGHCEFQFNFSKQIS